VPDSRLEGRGLDRGPFPALPAGGPCLSHPILILAPMSAMRTCWDCDEGRDHCHETLVEHRAGHLECPDPACDADRLRHAWLAPCRVLSPSCPCLPDRDGAGATPERAALAA